jgi:hypothetical protein
VFKAHRLLFLYRPTDGYQPYGNAVVNHFIESKRGFPNLISAKQDVNNELSKEVGG